VKHAFALLLVIHGAIHLLGFVKGFGLAPVAQLKDPISRPAGALWLLAALLFLVTAALLYAAPGRWWVAAAPAILLSQALVFGAWSDARFGTVANAIVLVPLAVALLQRAPWSLRAEFDRAVDVLLESPYGGRTDARLREHFDRLVDRINAYEVTALAQGELMRVALEHQMIENDRSLIAAMIKSFGQEPRVSNVVRAPVSRSRASTCTAPSSPGCAASASVQVWIPAPWSAASRATATARRPSSSTTSV